MASYVFPSSLTSINSKAINKSNQPFIHIMLYDWQVGNKLDQDTSSIATKVAEYFIAIPETTIQEQYNHSWESNSDMTQFISGGIMKKLKGLGQRLGNFVLGDSTNGVESLAGYMLNDFVKQNYHGIDFRQFEFLFNMIPKSLAEANTIKSIMTSLKLHTTPTYGNGMFVEYPAIVQFVVYSGGESNTPLFRSQFCGVQSLGFNYSPSGFMRTFQDGTPVQIHMNLSLKELKKVSDTGI